MTVLLLPPAAGPAEISVIEEAPHWECRHVLLITYPDGSVTMLGIRLDDVARYARTAFLPGAGD